MSDPRRRALLRQLDQLTQDWRLAITHAEDDSVLAALERQLTGAKNIAQILALADGAAGQFTVALQIGNLAR